MRKKSYLPLLSAAGLFVVIAVCTGVYLYLDKPAYDPIAEGEIVHTTETPAGGVGEWSTVWRTEDVSLDIAPYSDKHLLFSLRAQTMNTTDTSFKDAAVRFERTTGIVYLTYPPESTTTALRVHPYDSTKSIEEQLKSFYTERAHQDPGFDAEEFGNGCTLFTSNYQGTDIYTLHIKDEYQDLINKKYGDSMDAAWYCGATSFYRVGNLLIENYKLPIDATEPGLVPGTLRLL